MNKNEREITPVNIKMLYKTHYKDVRVRIATIIMVLLLLFIGLRWSISYKEEVEAHQYGLKQLLMRDNRVFDNLITHPSEEFRIGIESILIFMIMGALILSFKKGTIGITLGFFIGAILGLLISIYYPHLIYIIEMCVK